MRKRTLVTILAALIIVRKSRSDLEGDIWKLIPNLFSNRLRESYIFTYLFRSVCNCSAYFFAGISLLFKPHLLQLHLFPPHLVANNIQYCQNINTTNKYRLPHQTLDVYAPTSTRTTATSFYPTFIFIHGGIWTLFNKTFMRLIGERFAERGIICIIPSYSYYPDGIVDDQIEDIQNVITWTKRNITNYGGDENQIVLGGQSSGAHVSSLYMLQSICKKELCGYIGLSGVYDPLQHNIGFEKQRGVDQISPLVPANGGMANIAKYSSCNYVKMIVPNEDISKLPAILLLHGTKDTTVPVLSSDIFYKALCTRCDENENNESKKTGHGDRRKIEMKLIDGIDHAKYLYDISTTENGAEGHPMMDAMVEFIHKVSVRK